MLSKLHELSKNNTDRLNWDEYFMSIALLASQRSPCTRLHVGSVVVKNNRLISMGYNGYIPGAPHTSRVHDNHEQSIIHSEMNAIADCAKRGVSFGGCKNIYYALSVRKLFQIHRRMWHQGSYLFRQLLQRPHCSRIGR